MSAQEAETTSTILLIGDDATVRQLLETVARKRGGRIETVPNSEACLELVKNRRFDLVVTDAGSPGREDLEFLRRVRWVRPETKVSVRAELDRWHRGPVGKARMDLTTRTVSPHDP